MDNIANKATEHGDYDYGYDDLYRLDTVDNPTQDDEAFTYDPVGNRLTDEGVTGGIGLTTPITSLPVMMTYPTLMTTTAT